MLHITAMKAIKRYIGNVIENRVIAEFNKFVEEHELTMDWTYLRHNPMLPKKLQSQFDDIDDAEMQNIIGPVRADDINSNFTSKGRVNNKESAIARICATVLPDVVWFIIKDEPETKYREW